MILNVWWKLGRKLNGKSRLRSQNSSGGGLYRWIYDTFGDSALYSFKFGEHIMVFETSKTLS